MSAGILFNNGVAVTATGSGTAGQLFQSNGPGSPPDFVDGNSLYPIFVAYATTTQSGVTGSGTFYQVHFDATDRNDGNTFNTSTFVFTAPKDGAYFFVINLSINGLLASNDFQTTFLKNGSVQQNNLLLVPFTISGGGGEYNANASAVVLMAANDTMQINISSSGNVGDNVNVIGNGTSGAPGQTTFCGSFLSDTSSASVNTINVDNSGAVSGSAIDLYANSGSANAGASVSFTAASATEIDLVVTDASLNTFIGSGSGNLTLSSSQSSGFGYNCLNSLTSGSSNTAYGVNSSTTLQDGNFNSSFGEASLYNNISGSYNSSLGFGALSQLTLGNSNVGIGYNSVFQVGANYTTNESSNIVMQNAGVTGESNVMRLGTTGSGDGEINSTFIAGISGVTVSNAEMVTIDTATGEMGSQTIPGANAEYFAAYTTSAATDNFFNPLIFDTVISNIGSNYDNTTGIYTIPSDGLYYFTASFSLTGVTIAVTDLEFVIQNIAVANIASVFINPYTTYAAINVDVAMSVSGMYNCTTGQTIQVILATFGGNVTLNGSVPFQFSGFRIGL